MDNFIGQYHNNFKIVKDINNNINEIKKLQKNIYDYNNAEHLKREQNLLGFKNLSNLYPHLERTDYEFVSHPLSVCATDICHDTYISQIGAIQLVCAAISCALCGKVKCKVSDNWNEPAIDQVLQFAESGKRKSACIERIAAPFINFTNSINSSLEDRNIEERKIVGRKICNGGNTEILKRCINNRLTSRDYEGMFSLISQNIEERDKFIGQYKHFIAPLYCGGSRPGLEESMIKNGGCSAIINSEGEQFLDLVEKGFDLLLKSHTQENYSRTVKNRNINILYPSLPMAICTQPVIAHKLYTNEELRKRGLLNRYMPYFHYNQPLFKSMLITPNMDEYISKITTLLRRFYSQHEPKELATVELDDEALVELMQFEREIDELRKKSNEISGWLSKLCGQAVRYACDIHFWSDTECSLEKRITKNEMHWGIITARSSIEHAKFAFSENGLSALEGAKIIIYKLGGIQNMYSISLMLNNEITESALMKLVNMKLHKLRNALRYLESKDYLRMIELPNGKIKIRLRP